MICFLTQKLMLIILKIKIIAYLNGKLTNFLIEIKYYIKNVSFYENIVNL